MSSPVLGGAKDDTYVVLPDFFSDEDASRKVTAFLQTIDLDQYAQDLKQRGVTTPERVKSLTERELLAWGLPQTAVKKILKFSSAIDNIVQPVPHRAASERMASPTWT